MPNTKIMCPKSSPAGPLLTQKAAPEKLPGAAALHSLKLNSNSRFGKKFFAAKRLCLFLLQIFAKGLKRNALPQFAQAAKLLAGLGLHAVIHPVNNLAKTLALVKAN